MDATPREELLSAMAENRRTFLSFLERRVGHRETAEDLLQESFARSLNKVPLEAGESVTAWFYRVLRNGLIDHYRRKGASDRALASLEKELAEVAPEMSPDERDEVCRCVTRLSETLKPEYALALRRVEVEGVALRDYAAEVGITPNNAAVRVFRARETLRKRVVHWCGSCAERGCVDCTCGEPGSSGCAHEA
jgi:RNA polymerase sigma-70 factor (ECF subfamily)